MVCYRYKIKDPLGFHARPVGLLVKECNKYFCDIQIEYNGKVVDAKRMFSVLSLGVKNGEEIIIKFDGENEVQALTNIKKLLENEKI